MLRLDDEKDPEVLRQAARLLEAENRRLTAKVLELTKQLMESRGEERTALQLRLQELERQLAERNKKIFGTSSEKRPASGGEAPAEKKPQTGHGRREQKALPIREQLFTLDVADRQCPKCGGGLSEMKGQFEESEEITVVERQFVLTKLKQQKYRCSCNACIETALGPPKLFAGARYSIDFAIEVAIAKYIDHMPLERQVRSMARDGLVVESQTLWDYLERLARILGGAHEALHAYVLGHDVIGADETPWKLLGQKDRATQRWQAWAVSSPSAVCHRIYDSRSAEAAKQLLREYSGVVVVDDYGAYKSLAQTGQFTIANCWAHVRRKFIEAETAFPLESKAVVDRIRELYEIERSCPTGPPGDELRRQLRNQRSRPKVAELKAQLVDMARSRAIPNSGLEKAIAYALGCWTGLERFLDDPRIPIDNNATERALRGVVLGRKNHFGSKSKRGTEVAALFYSLMESAKLVGLDPRAYLRAATAAALAGTKVPLPHDLAANPAA